MCQLLLHHLALLCALFPSIFAEWSALKWGCEEITNHKLGTTEIIATSFFVDAVFDEEVSHIDMSCSFTTRQFNIMFQDDSAFVVLVNNITLNFLAQSEIASPQHVSNNIIHCH
jgi:hypothetical protein